MIAKFLIHKKSNPKSDDCKVFNNSLKAKNQNFKKTKLLKKSKKIKKT